MSTPNPIKSIGRYQIESELGRGAMGAVFRAKDPRIERTVALKTIAVLGATPDQEGDFRKRFFREAQAAGRMSHPGIVTIFDAGEDEVTHTPYIAMEYVAGKTLEHFASEGNLSTAAQLELIEQVAEALHYAHAQGIVHRDVKPANIMITEEGRPKIMDFGIAKVSQSEFTAVGQVLGTPAYMAPEQLTGGVLDGRSDLFSLGNVLYWILAGEKPFTGETAAEISFQVVYKDPASLLEKNPACTPAFDYVVRRAMAKDPAKRYQTGRELALDLSDLRQGRPPRSMPTASGATAERTVIQSAERTMQSTPVRTQFGTSDSREFEKTRVLKEDGQETAKTVSKKNAALAGVGLLLVAILVAGYFVRGGIGAKSVLQVRVKHSFRTAQLKISIDGKPFQTDVLTGLVRKDSKWFKSTYIVTGFSSLTLSVPAGKHKIEVTVDSEEGNYSDTKSLEAEFPPNAEKTLHVNYRPGSHEMELAID